MIRGCKNQKRRMFMKEFKCGLRDGIPIAVGYFAVSFGFGVVAFQDGIPAWLSVLMSLTNVTSAGQFAGLEIIAAASGVMLATVLEMILTQFIINLRYALMSLSLTQKLSPSGKGWQRFVIAFANTDEIFAVAMAHTGDVTFPYMLGLQLLPILGWTGGTAAGALACGLLPTSLQVALGVALYGMFIAIVVPVARRSRPVMSVVLLALLFSCALKYIPGAVGLPEMSGGFAIILCTVLAAGIGAAFFKSDDREEDDA